MAIFDDELIRLKEKILEMGALVENSIKDAIKSLIEKDNELAKKVIQRDHIINSFDVEIDEECIRLIALRQPKASDLRFITTAMKIVTDIERMGDLAANIAERALDLNKEPDIKPFVDIPRMRDIALGMTRDALDAFVHKDKKLAMDVIMRDDEIDDLKHAIISDLLFLMLEDPNVICRAMRITFIAQYLERFADHATNIAEMVIYLVEGKIIRHTAIPE